MKKFGQSVLAAGILCSGLLFGTSDAFAMGSKGSISFSTDANTYSRNATSIDVSGQAPPGGCVLELVSKGGDVVKRIDVDAGINGKWFNESFYLNGVSAGQYDVVANGAWGSERTYHGELTAYITVNR
ncbi:hypothetical protein [Bacillus gaemokensis]|uniref:Uncharacterized protein n=1 Tax=Bacillus gaemokensis TaxID=574375 RepID=A0A073K7H9_9BACI|nr:hypothetical protein [Bacillus gaemokensis]KEK22510.1 hypothetical protein BAGA_19110 [Bacillus gaemokensis]KYG28793.1 hypothetical protein AZF08_13795 [Bacillus gaemokensis]